MNTQAIFNRQKYFLVSELQNTFNQSIYISDFDIKPFFITFYTRFDAYLESIAFIYADLSFDDSEEYIFFTSLRSSLQKHKLNSLVHFESSSNFVQVVEALLEDLQK